MTSLKDGEKLLTDEANTRIKDVQRQMSQEMLARVHEKIASLVYVCEGICIFVACD